MRSIWLGLALVVACGTNDDRPPASSEGSGGSRTGGTKATADSGSSSENPGGSDAGQPSAPSGGGEGGGGGDGIMYEAAGVPGVVPGVCDPEMTLGQAEPQDFGVPDGALLSMTPDELTLAFTTGLPPALVLHVGARANTGEAFDEEIVPVPDGYEASSGAALSSDGLRLLLVLKDHSGFGELSRRQRSQPFGAEADTTAFAKLNAQKPMSGRELGWPVLSADGRELYFLSSFGQGLVMHSTLAEDGRFDLGVELDKYLLAGAPGAYPLINGLSVDRRALFYVDEATQHSMVLFFSSSGAPSSQPLDLGDRQGVAPNQDCSRLYSSVAGQLVVQPVE